MQRPRRIASFRRRFRRLLLRFRRSFRQQQHHRLLVHQNAGSSYRQLDRDLASVIGFPLIKVFFSVTERWWSENAWSRDPLARVSTDKQDTENQLLQLREFAVRQGWTVVRECCDYESGSKADRAHFQQMFADASRRKFDLLPFWALDRLSREGALKTLQRLDRLEGYGVGFRSFTEPYFDSCGIFKEAVVSIVATLAKQERVKRSERTKAGLARVRSEGRRLGRPRVAVNPTTERAKSDRCTRLLLRLSGIVAIDS